MAGLRSGPSGKLLTGLDGQALAWDSTLKAWVPETLVNLMPGAPSYDITKPPFNASGTSLAPDDSNALSAAIAAANVNPGVIWLGSRHRYTASLELIRNNNILVLGRGAFNGGTIVQCDAPTPIHGFIVSQCQYSGVANLWISSRRAQTTGAGVKLTEVFRGFAHNVVVTGFGFGTETDRCTLTEYAQVNPTDINGFAGHYAYGAGGVFNHAVKYRDCACGTNYPLPLAGVAGVWAPSTNYIVGQAVLANGNIYQCAQTGQSAASGTGPSGIPSAFVSDAHTMRIADGTAEWVYAMPALSWFLMSSYCNTFEVLDSGGLQGGEGLGVVDLTPGPGSAPLFCRTHNLQIDHPFNRGMRLAAGSAHRNSMLFVTSVLGGTGIEVNCRNWELNGGEVFGCKLAGITVAQGDGLIAGLQVGAIGGGALANTRDCLEIAPGVTAPLRVIGNSFGEMDGGRPATSRYGASIGAGCDNYSFVGNTAVGNLTGGYLNTPGASASRVFSGNVGSIV